MKKFTLTYYSAAATEIPSLSLGAEQFNNTYGCAVIHAKTQAQLFDEQQVNAFVDQCLQSNIVIIGLHGGKTSCPAFGRLEQKIAELKMSGRPLPMIHIQPTGGDEEGMEAAESLSTHYDTPHWKQMFNYLHHGGMMNFTNLLVYIESILCDPEKTIKAETVKPPMPLPHEGIYHPDFEGTPDLSKLIKKNHHPGQLTIGLWFNQVYWLNNNLAYIDALICSIEKQGHNVIPVFHLRYKDKARGNKGADYVARTFFMKDGQPLIDVLINPLMFSLTLLDPSCKSLFQELNVPVIQAMLTMQTKESWEKAPQGMASMEVGFSAAQPEFDGTLISVPVATREQNTYDPMTGALITKYMPIPDRVDKVVRLAANWGRLSKKKNKEKKVAIIFHHYPPRNDRIGCAAGLDSFSSVKSILDRMIQEDYQVAHTYKDSDALAKQILSGMTCDNRWLLPEQMAERAQAVAEPSDYNVWHENLPAWNREKQTSDWGPMPGDLFVHDNKLMFPGLLNGNFFITIQPPRGYFENIEQIYHDLYLSPPHHYPVQYRYIKEVFKADAVIHVGKHGSLEWLPGKALGLSETCWPDTAIMDLPNIYPYIINDPSEGTQAKRRSFACIVDHLTPVLTNADLYESLADVDRHVNAWYDAVREDPGKTTLLRPIIWKAVTKANLDKDLQITEESAMADFDYFLEQLHAYLEELNDTMINKGLHTLGKTPVGEDLTEFLVQLTRVSNGNVPSLREAVVKAIGYDYDQLLNNKGRMLDDGSGLTGAMVIRRAHSLALKLIAGLLSVISQSEFEKDADKKIRSLIESVIEKPVLEIEVVLSWIADTLLPKVERTTDEIDSIIHALEGSFVKPGPSGAPSRGQADILPTGRNFYSVDPQKIPSPAAWEVGKRLGDTLLEKYLDDEGEYPRSVGIIVYGGSTMRTQGDDIAQVLYLLGVKPVWHSASGIVKGLEVIPQTDLGRPRIDVVPRISGFFRDGFPLLVEQMDEAVQMVAVLDEPLESNMIRRHVLRDMESFKYEGMSDEDAFREASFRIFGCPPGTYGAGVSELVESGNWKTRDDLGNNYIRYSSYAYGKNSYGSQKPAVFKTLLSRMDVTVKNEDSREYDMMSCTDYYNYYGGLIVATQTVKGTAARSFMGDSSDPERVKIRSTAEEAKHVLRSRLVNPKWISGMMQHGYKGAGDLSQMMDVALGWDATADVMEDWMYEQMARSYVFDGTVREWMEKVNPWARQNILNKLLEAISRGMWNAESDMENELKQEYLEIEGEIEALTE